MTFKRIIRPEEVCAMAGFSRATLYRLEAQGRFPSRIKIGAHATGYVLAEVEEWIEERIADRTADRRAQ